MQMYMLCDMLFENKTNMVLVYSKPWLLWSLILLMFGIQHSHSEVKSDIFLSPMFALGPGSVESNYYYNIDFPSGHIALKSVNGELVDEDGTPVPLHETYMHHWAVGRYHQRKGLENPKLNDIRLDNPDYTLVRNSGICQGGVLAQYFGVGSETRKTSTYIPDPYGMEVGNNYEIPDGYEERWYLNVHAIDTRGVEDRSGCIECRCALYNVTYVQPLGPKYEGGLHCCYDRTQCKVNPGAKEPKRNLYFRYTVKWVEWNLSVIPVKLYIIDVTDTWKRSSGLSSLHGCKVEYDVQSCSSYAAEERCIDTRSTRVTIPSSGYITYGVAHQHAGGVGATLHRKDGSVICSSLPTYGQGKEAGNESGYIVGMSTCYPEPGSIKITAGESLILESSYNSTKKRTGVMGIFYIMVAEDTS